MEKGKHTYMRNSKISLLVWDKLMIVAVFRLMSSFSDSFKAQVDVFVRRMSPGSPRRLRIELQIFPDRQRLEIQFGGGCSSMETSVIQQQLFNLIDLPSG